MRRSRKTPCFDVVALMAVAVMSAALWLWLAPSASAAAWTPVAPPPGDSADMNDISAFGLLSVAAAGDGRISVTRNGGRSWSSVTPTGFEGAIFTTIAMDVSGRGVTASGGYLLVKRNWAGAWQAPVFDGPSPNAAINAVALQGLHAVAVGEEGMILSSEDGGATWRRVSSPTVSSLTCVALAGDGTGVAGAESGEILTGSGESWKLAGSASAPITSVAASATPSWGDGNADLLAATGHDVLGSDGETFASLPGLPDLSPQLWPAITRLDIPPSSLLLAGEGMTGLLQLLGGQWSSSGIGSSSGLRVVAVPDQTAAYLLTADGRLLRTLSAGREPLLEPSAESVVIGGTVRLQATPHIGAPGSLLLSQRVPGRPWQTLRKVAWTSADAERSLTFTVKPTLTQQYRLQFLYGSSVVDLTPAVKVTMVPKITTASATLRLRVGATYRLSGSVTPSLPGARVELLTDRGGKWRRVSLQGALPLRNGRTWTSRNFGTPRAETYHLRAHLIGSGTYGEAWSRIVTVTIR